MLVPPDNFALVEDGIYRCSKLDPINNSFLDTLQLKSIVWMDEENPTRVLSEYMEENHIRLYHITDSNILQEDSEISSFKHQDWMVLRPTLISKVIRILLNSRNNHNCLLIDKSAVVVGILRHIERWCYSSIANEYRLFSGSKANYNVESFLELINIELEPHNEENDEDEGSLQQTHGRRIVDGSKAFYRKNPDVTDKERKNLRGQSIPYKPSYTRKYSSSLEKFGALKEETPEEAIDDSSMSEGSVEKYSPRMDISFGSSYKTSEAISIEGRRPSWAARRVSENYGNSPLQGSAGSGKLSMSTSPQIPKNLLKLVEDRKQRKKQRELYRKQHELNESKNDSNLNALEGNNRSITEAGTVEQGALSQGMDKSFGETKLSGMSDEHEKVMLYHFYRPQKQFKVINDRNKVLATTVKIPLPKEEDLPLWFISLRDSWEKQYRELNTVKCRDI
ncbi:hypothetical protein HII12_001049 [Brettanomyces bruxellensis]|uniref:Putative tyrosine-protein phosphatase OCA1 n=1 Tax=Dekkera bruxellensis TaxID=5007 RepID=A0A8H6BNW6_DEKBR|nr:hypothetical protein HII12_001049 [Brettanomyces bruxellensis]